MSANNLGANFKRKIFSNYKSGQTAAIQQNNVILINHSSDNEEAGDNDDPCEDHINADNGDDPSECADELEAPLPVVGETDDNVDNTTEAAAEQIAAEESEGFTIHEIIMGSKSDSQNSFMSGTRCNIEQRVRDIVFPRVQIMVRCTYFIAVI
jgi:hypothetical protein